MLNVDMRQRWTISKGVSDWCNIHSVVGISGGKTYLNTTFRGTLVNLAARDDKSEQQRWILSDAPEKVKVNKNVALDENRIAV